MQRYLLIAVGLIVVAWFCWPKKKQLPPEAAVSAAIDEMIAAAEGKRAKPIIARLSKSFKGDGMSRDQAKAAIVMHLQRGSWSKVFIVAQDVAAVGQTQVNVRLKAVLARGGNVKTLADIAPESAGAFQFTLTWELEDDDIWRIVAGAYSRVDVRGLLP